MNDGTAERITRAREKISRLEPMRGLLSEGSRIRVRDQELFIKALEMRQNGPKNVRIAEELGVSINTVRNWIYRCEEPLGQTNVPDFRLEEDVVRLLAATNTDANVDRTRFIDLHIVDYELAQGLRKSASNLLGKEIELKVDISGTWRVHFASTFLAAVAERIRQQPELIHDFLASHELKREYCRLFFAYDGGPQLAFDRRKYIKVEVAAYEEKGRLDALIDVLADFNIQTRGPSFRRGVYEVFVSGDENVGRFAAEVGIKGYKGEKLLDALWLKNRFQRMIEDGTGRSEAFRWAQEMWQEYYVANVGSIGYVPYWYRKAYEVAHSNVPLEEKVARVEKLYTQNRQSNLRSLNDTSE